MWIGISGKTPVGRIHGGQLTLFGAPEGLGPGYTRSLVRDHAGVMWAAASSGLYRFESRRWHRVGESEGLPDGATLAVSKTAHGGWGRARRRPSTGASRRAVRSSAWTSSARRATCGRTSARTRTAASSPAISSRAIACPGARGRGRRVAGGAQRCCTTGAVTSGWGRWGKASGACTVTARASGRGARPRSREGLISNAVAVDVHEDRDGNIWLGTLAGLQRLSPHRVTPIRDLPIPRAIAATPDGSVWVGTTAGFTRFTRRDGATTPRPTDCRALSCSRCRVTGSTASGCRPIVGCLISMAVAFPRSSPVRPTRDSGSWASSVARTACGCVIGG